MTHITIAVTPHWFDDRELIKLYVLGLLYRSTKRRDFTVDFVESNDYGVLGLVNCEPESDYQECEIAATRLSDKMQFRDRNDPFAEARKLSKEDREDRARIEKLFDDFLEERRD